MIGPSDMGGPSAHSDAAAYSDGADEGDPHVKLGIRAAEGLLGEGRMSYPVGVDVSY